MDGFGLPKVRTDVDLKRSLIGNTDPSFQKGLKKLEAIEHRLLKCSYQSEEHTRLEIELIRFLKKQSPGKNLHDMVCAAIEVGLNIFMLGEIGADKDPNKKNIAIQVFSTIVLALPSDQAFIESIEVETYKLLIPFPTAQLSWNDVQVINVVENRKGCPLTDLFWAEKIIDSKEIKQSLLPQAKRLLDKAKEGIGEDLQPYLQKVQAKYDAHTNNTIWSGEALKTRYESSDKLTPFPDSERAAAKKQVRDGNMDARIGAVVSARGDWPKWMEKYAALAIKNEGTIENQRWLHNLRFNAMLNHLTPKKFEEQIYVNLFLEQPIDQQLTDTSFFALKKRLVDAYKHGHYIAALLLVRLYLSYPNFDKAAKKEVDQYLKEVGRHLIERGEKEMSELSERVKSMPNMQIKKNDSSVKRSTNSLEQARSGWFNTVQKKPKSDARRMDMNQVGLSSEHSDAKPAPDPMVRSSKKKVELSRSQSSPAPSARPGVIHHAPEDRPSLGAAGIDLAKDQRGEPT